MARSILTGVPEIEATLKALSDKVGDKIARGALRAGISVIAREMRKTAPVGATGQLKRSIGTKVGKSSKGVFVAKAGINVGKKTRKKGRFAPHGHLVALGTVKRHREKIGGTYGWIKPLNPTPEQLTTGVMPSNPFVKTAYQATRSRAMSVMNKQAAKSLAREAAKLSK